MGLRFGVMACRIIRRFAKSWGVSTVDHPFWEYTRASDGSPGFGNTKSFPTPAPTSTLSTFMAMSAAKCPRKRL